MLDMFKECTQENKYIYVLFVLLDSAYLSMPN